MKIKVLASGSKGNSTYIECNNVKFLIDAGISYLQIKKELEKIHEDINNLNFIILTHTHSDHIKGLQSLLKKTNICLYAKSEILETLIKTIEINNYHLLEDYFIYNNVEIEAIPLSHDVICYGYIITYNNKEIVYITDTGYLNRKYFEKLKNKEVYIIEANHNEKMLMEGPYPYILKQRIISDKGHLSNSTCGKILSKLIGPKTKYIFLAHISEHNNTTDLAFEEVAKEIMNSNFNTKNIIITSQYVSLDEVEV